MTSVKIPYIQDRYNPLTLTMERGTHLIIEQNTTIIENENNKKDNYIVIDDIFEFMGKLNYLINNYQFRVLKSFIDKKEVAKK